MNITFGLLVFALIGIFIGITANRIYKENK